MRYQQIQDVYRLTVRKEIEQDEWSETKVENRIEIEKGKQEVATIHSNCIVRHEKKKLNSRLKTNSRPWQEPCPNKIPLLSVKKL